MTDMIYNLPFINNLTIKLKNEGLLDPDSEILEVIQKIYSQVGSPNYIKTPVFSKPDQKYDNRRKKRFEKPKQQLTTDELKKYAPQVGVRDLSDIDKIRALLNKLTDKNYKEIELRVIQFLDEIDNIYNETPDCQDKLKKLGEVIYNISSTNRFYSRNYACLFTLLSNKYSYIRDIFDENYILYKLQFDNIKYVDSNDNYDEFCSINKLNEKRRALTLFIVNLCLYKLVGKDDIIDLTKHLVSLMNKMINDENKKNEIDEIIENISIIYNKDYITDYGNILIDEKGLSISGLFEKLSNCQINDYNGLTNRSKFKIMDLNEM